MNLKALLRTLLYGFLLFTRPQAIWGLRSAETSQDDGLTVLDAMSNYRVAVAPTVTDFITRVENYPTKTFIQEQLIEDLETHYQVDHYLDENMLEKIISLHNHAEHNDEIAIMYYTHLKTYIALCNKNLGLPTLKKSIIAQYKAVEKNMVLESMRPGPNPIEGKFYHSWGKLKTKPQVATTSSFKQDIDIDTLSQLLEDATQSIFQDQYKTVIEALKYMSKQPADRLSFQAKKLMSHALSHIKNETHYSTAHIKIPAVSENDATEYVQSKLQIVVDLLKPLEGKAQASENAQKIIMDSLSTNHELMLDELEKLLTHAENANDPFLIREAKMAFYIGYHAFMEFNIHEKSNLQVYKKSTMDKITSIRTYIQSPETRAPKPIHPPFLQELRVKISKSAAKQPPKKSAEFFESFSKEIKTGKERDVEMFLAIISYAEISPLRESYHLLKNKLTAFKQQHDINTLSPEIIVLMRHSSFMLKSEINENVPIDRQLTETQFEQGIKNCGLPEKKVLDAADKEASAQIKIEYINYMSKKVIRIFLEHTPHDSTESLFQTIANYFNKPDMPEKLDAGYVFFALALEQINKTTPFTSQNLTEQAWQTIRDFESNMAKQPSHQMLYLHIKKIIIERFSAQPAHYNIPIALILLIILIFAITKLSERSIKKIEKKINTEDPTPKFTSNITSSYQSTLSVDPFPDLWEKFEQFAKSELGPVNENINDLLSKHHKHILQKGKLIWINQDNEQRLLEFLNCNIDWLVQQDKLKVEQVLQGHCFDGLSLTLKNKRLALDKQNQINVLKQLLDIKPPQTKFDNKNFVKGIKFINALIPEKLDDALLPSNMELVNTISNQLKFQSRLNGPEIDYILAELVKIYNDLKTNKGYVAPTTSLINNDNNSDAIVPDFLYQLWIPHDNPGPQTTPNAPVVKSKQVVNHKIEITLNPPYRAFASNVTKHLNLAFNEHTRLTNRAYKLLIIQFHSLILKDKSTGYHQLLNDIRNRFCHKWELIGHSHDLQVILHHILRLIEQTHGGSLSSIADLDKELQLYPQKILALETTANPIYKGKASAKEKIITLLQEFDDTTILYANKEFGELAQLAIVDILCEIAETLTHSNIAHTAAVWPRVRATGYHSDTPKQEIIDQAITEGIPELKKIFQYSSHNNRKFSCAK